MLDTMSISQQQSSGMGWRGCLGGYLARRESDGIEGTIQGWQIPTQAISITCRHQGKHHDGDHSQGDSDQKERRVLAEHSRHGLPPRVKSEGAGISLCFWVPRVYWVETLEDDRQTASGRAGESG
jgi:hypothetical protein